MSDKQFDQFLGMIQKLVDAIEEGSERIAAALSDVAEAARNPPRDPR